jgi:hypothetical protein
MKRLSILLPGLVVTLYLGGIPALAQHGHGAGVGAGHDARSHGESKTEPNKGVTPGKMTVGEHLVHNTKLADKLTSLLGPKEIGPKPAPFQSIEAAAKGFKNLGQFVAAVHVSHNLGIPFDQLRAKMIAGDSLGKAIHELKPEANAKVEFKKAKHEADEDLKEAKS